MVDLLQVINMPLPEKLRKGNVVPLALPFQVDPDVAPYLVSGSKEPTVWVASAPMGKLHAGVRSEENFRTEVVDAITLMSMQSDWGNVGDFSSEGVEAGVEFLKEMGFDEAELEFVAHADTEVDFLSEKRKLETADWAPRDCILILPKDRSFLGWIGSVAPGKIVSVVHNPSRGIAIARE